MSRNGLRARDAQIRRALDSDPGPVDDADCAAHCDRDAVYRVPHQRGGDVDYCPFHLAYYRHEHPHLWERLESAPDEVAPEPNRYAEIGSRFVSLSQAPDQLENLRLVAILHTGRALYESATPDDDGRVEYVAVDASLERVASTTVHRSDAGDAVREIGSLCGYLESTDEFREALGAVGPSNGGESA